MDNILFYIHSGLMTSIRSEYKTPRGYGGDKAGTGQKKEQLYTFIRDLLSLTEFHLVLFPIIFVYLVSILQLLSVFSTARSDKVDGILLSHTKRNAHLLPYCTGYLSLNSYYFGQSHSEGGSSIFTERCCYPSEACP